MDKFVIINCNSAQIYRELQIISARPTQDEMAGITHKLFGYRSGVQSCSAASWAEDAKAEIAAAHEQGKMPILVGGTGLYIRTLLEGIAPIPDIDPQIRAAIRAANVADNYAALSQEDPVCAERLNPADTTRIARALEVIRSTGQPLHHWQAQKIGGIGDKVDVQGLVLLPPREWLFERCDRRFMMMLEQGAVEEARDLANMQLNPDLPIMRAIGVREIIAYAQGEIGKDEAFAMGAQATRRYAKRQYTWFRNQTPENWLRYCSMINDKNADKIISLLQK